MQEPLTKLIVRLKEELGRFPTENEIYIFSFGDEEDKKRILSRKKI